MIERLRQYRAEILILLLMLGGAGWLRLRDLDRYIASDELRWVCRSIGFHDALSRGDWAGTYQVGHPGVLTMWAGTLALPLEDAGEWVGLCRDTNGGQNLGRFDDVGNEGLIQTIAPLLWQARRGVAVLSVLLLGLVYATARVGLGLPAGPALGGLVLLAFDPFLIGLTKVMHVDGLLALALLAAVMALWRALSLQVADEADGLGARGDLHWPAIAGAVAGLGMLAKSAGFAIGPFALLAFLWAGWRRRAWAWAARGFLVWGIAAALVYGALWPAMWVDPVGTLLRDCGQGLVLGADEDAAEESGCRLGVVTKMLSEGGQPHQSGLYFRGEPVADPGMIFYLVASAYRLTPLGLLGALMAMDLVLMALWSAWRQRDLDGMPRKRARLLWLLSWALYFLLFLGLASKKSDRYLLTSLTALNMLAGAVLIPALVSAGWRLKRWREQAEPFSKSEWRVYYWPVALFALVMLVAALFMMRYNEFRPFVLLSFLSLLTFVLIAPMYLRMIWRRRAALPDVGNVPDEIQSVESDSEDSAGRVLVFLLMGLILSMDRVSSMDYPLTYANSVLGGAPAAQYWIPLGWGEGYDLAAEYLNDVAARDWPEAESWRMEASVRGVSNFAPLFQGRTRSASGKGYQPGRTDYVVLYRNQVDRRRNESLLRLYWDDPAQEPVYTGSINGVEMVWVYANATLEPLKANLRGLVGPGEIVLAGGESVLAKQAYREWTILRYWGHQSDEDIEDELIPALPPDWQRVWVVRYPGFDPPAVRGALDEIAEAGETVVLEFPGDSSAEITPYERRP